MAEMGALVEDSLPPSCDRPSCSDIHVCRYSKAVFMKFMMNDENDTNIA